MLFFFEIPDHLKMSKSRIQVKNQNAPLNIQTPGSLAQLAEWYFFFWNGFHTCLSTIPPMSSDHMFTHSKP